MDLINARPVIVTNSIHQWGIHHIKWVEWALIREGCLTEQEVHELKENRLDPSDRDFKRNFKAWVLKEFTDPSDQEKVGLLVTDGWRGRQYLVLPQQYYEIIKEKIPSLLDEKPKPKYAVPGPNGFYI